MNYTFEANKEILADTIDITYKNLLDWDGYKDIDYNQKEVYDQIYNYFNWLSKMLSEKGVISKTEIRNKIIELNNF